VGDQNAAAVRREHSSGQPGSTTYMPLIRPPSNVTGWVSGILFNVQGGRRLRSAGRRVGHRTALREGNGGTSVASGSGTISVADNREQLHRPEWSSRAGEISRLVILGTAQYWSRLRSAPTGRGMAAALLANLRL